MEYLILLLIYLSLPWIVNHKLLPVESVLLMSPIESVIVPYLLMALLVFIFTYILLIIRAMRTCPVQKTQAGNVRSWGISSGWKLSALSSLFATFFYVLVHYLPILTVPFLAISILPYATDIGYGFFLMIGAFGGFFLGRAFIGLC